MSLNCYYFTTRHPRGGEFFNRGFLFLSQNINIYDLIFFPFSRGCKNEGVRISAIFSEGGLQTKVEWPHISLNTYLASFFSEPVNIIFLIWYLSSDALKKLLMNESQLEIYLRNNPLGTTDAAEAKVHLEEVVSNLTKLVSQDKLQKVHFTVWILTTVVFVSISLGS